MRILADDDQKQHLVWLKYARKK
jgi:hypothetical protein